MNTHVICIVTIFQILFRVPLDRATLFSVDNTAVLVLMTLEWCHTEPDLTFLVSVRVRDWHRHLSQTDTYVWKILSWPSKLKPCLTSIMTYINVIVLDPFIGRLLLIIIRSYLPYNRFILVKKIILPICTRAWNNLKPKKFPVLSFITLKHQQKRKKYQRHLAVEI